MKFFFRCLFSAVGGIVIAWLSYAWLLDMVCSIDGLTIVYESIQQMYFYKVAFAFSVGLLSVFIFISAKNSFKLILTLISISIATTVFWLFYVRQKIGQTYEGIRGATPLKDFGFGVNEVPLYQAGLISLLVTAVVVFIVTQVKKKSNLNQHSVAGD